MGTGDNPVVVRPAMGDNMVDGRLAGVVREASERAGLPHLVSGLQQPPPGGISPVNRLLTFAVLLVAQAGCVTPVIPLPPPRPETYQIRAVPTDKDSISIEG